MQPRVVDISHHNKVTDLHATAAAGIWGVIHKSSQGRGYRDPDYATRRKLANAAGLLWGAYHFNDGSDVAAQVDWFIKCAAPDENTLMVLDFEDNPKSNMGVKQAVAFLRLLEQKTGRKGAIYSGNRLKETIGQLSAADKKYLCSHRLWLCQYGARAVLPTGFSKYWLWQYTGDGSGPQPHNVPGIIAGNKGIDLNVYDGDQATLQSEWTPAKSPLAMITQLASSHSAQAEADQVDDDQEDAGEDTPAVADAGNPELLAVKKILKGMNYNPGVLNDEWGGMTAGALAGFINDRGGDIPVPASLAAFKTVKADIRAELQKAQDETPPFVRPVSAARASVNPTTVAAVAPEVVPVKQNRTLTIWGAIGAFFTGVYKTFSDTISSAWDFVFDHKDDIPTDPGVLQTAWGYVTALPSEVWWFAGAIGFVFIAVRLHGAVQKINEGVKTGARQ